MRTAAAVIVFLLTYVLIATRRLAMFHIGRPAGALLGAVAMVTIGALTPEESYRAVDANTIVLLFGMMLLIAYLERAGLFERLAHFLLVRSKTPVSLLVVTSLVAGVLSAFLVNDTVCLFLAPVVVEACARGRLPFGPYLIGLATSSNIGCAATLVGNPQNMIIGNLSHISFARFLAYSGPAAAAGLLLNVVLLLVFYGRRLPKTLELSNDAFAPVTRAAPPSASPAQFRLTVLVTLLVIAGFLVGMHLGYTALAGVLVLMLADRRDPREAFARVDWPLLVFFASLFIVVEGLAKTGVVAEAWGRLAGAMRFDDAPGIGLFSLVVGLGSNLVSNVPMVLLAGPHMADLGGGDFGWVVLAFVSTVAGNLTLVGSVAALIVAERARSHYSLGFVEFMLFGVVSTIAVLAIGLPTLAVLARTLG